MENSSVTGKTTEVVRAEADLQNFMEMIPTSIMLLDDAGRCSFVNSAFTGFCGYVLEDLSSVGQWLCRICPDPADRDSIIRWYDRHISHDLAPVPPLMFEIICKNGAVRHVAIDARGTGELIVVTCTDITELEQLKKTERERAEIFRLTLDETTDAVLERERTESAFHEAAELLEKTFASLNEAVFIVKAGTRTIHDVNSAVEKLFGYTREEIIGKHTSCLHLSEQRYLQFCNERARAHVEKGCFETTWQMMRKDGTVFDSEHCVTPICDSNGDVISHVCVVRDITERIQGEEKLRKLVLEQGIILDNVCIGISFVRNRTFVWINNKFGEMFGYTNDELSGLSTEIIYPSFEMFKQAGENTYATVARNQLYTAEVEMRHRDGSLFWVKCYCKAVDPIIPAGGTIWIIEDIQARKQSERDLAENSRLLEDLNVHLEDRIAQAVEELRQKDDLIARQNRMLVDLAPEAIIVFDPQLNCIVDANDKAEELFGCSREMLFTSSILRFYMAKQPDGKSPEISVWENVEQVLAGKILVIDRAIKSVKGAEVLCEVRLIRVPSPNRALIRASFFDITERIKVQEELAKALASEHRLNEEQRQFMGLVSHELRTPLAIIDGSAQLLVLTAYQDSDCLMHAHRILSSTKRLGSLIHTCLTEERLCTSGWTPNKTYEDLGPLVRDVLAHAQAGSQLHSITSNVEQLPEKYLLDPMLVKVMLNNLLDNAIKYSPTGGNIELRGWCGERGELHFEVEDNGVGIAPDQVEKIFTRFYRVWQIPDVSGAGLGLHIVRRIAELHGGTVTCTSNPGMGSVFTVTIHS